MNERAVRRDDLVSQTDPLRLWVRHSREAQPQLLEEDSAKLLEQLARTVLADALPGVRAVAE
jgi:hypothetical protein